MMEQLQNSGHMQINPKLLKQLVAEVELAGGGYLPSRDLARSSISHRHWGE